MKEVEELIESLKQKANESLSIPKGAALVCEVEQVTQENWVDKLNDGLLKLTNLLQNPGNLRSARMVYLFSHAILELGNGLTLNVHISPSGLLSLALANHNE